MSCLGLRQKRLARPQLLRLISQCLFTSLILLACVNTGRAISLNQYRKSIQQAIGALDTLTQSDEQESLETYNRRRAETLRAVRDALPAAQQVEWSQGRCNVDNTWLHEQLQEFEKAANGERAELLARIVERLKALDEHLAEVDDASMAALPAKADSSKRLEEILRRPEYAKKVAEESALSRWIREFFKWLMKLFPRRTFQPGSADRVTPWAELLVVALAIALIGYVTSLFLPRFRRVRSRRKLGKPRPRVVLGERLAPDQSGIDLLSEAEALARQGQLRAAIRKAYIALLVELGDRKIISLAQHKTNRDYLRSVRERQRLYPKMAELTESFERHWYGLAHASEKDWAEFRAGYREALRD